MYVGFSDQHILELSAEQKGDQDGDRLELEGNIGLARDFQLGITFYRWGFFLARHEIWRQPSEARPRDSHDRGFVDVLARFLQPHEEEAEGRG